MIDVIVFLNFHQQLIIISINRRVYRELQHFIQFVLYRKCLVNYLIKCIRIMY